MKATGIIRRVDDLGRVVIPKEIRRQCHIREGEPLEIYVDTIAGKPAVCFQKYNAEIGQEVHEFSERLIDEYLSANEFATSEDLRTIRDALRNVEKIVRRIEKMEIEG